MFWLTVCVGVLVLVGDWCSEFWFVLFGSSSVY